MKEVVLPTKKRGLIVVGVLLLFMAPRLWLLLDTLHLGLAIDELRLATHAYLPLNELLKSVHALAPHPPLYFIQLHYWLSAGTGDIWLKLNPFAWSVLTVLSLGVVAYRIYGFNVAVLACIVYAVSPYSIAQSLGVRMYSMMAFLSVWVFFFTHWFIAEEQSLLPGVGIFVSTLAFLYSQGAGFIILSSSVSYALLLAWRLRTDKTVLVKWGIVQLAVIVLYLPWLFRARDIHLAHTLTPSATDMAYSFAQILFGAKIVLSSYRESILVGSTLLLGFIIVILTLVKASRILAISFIAMPIVACALVSHLIEPIWVTYTLMHIIPFLCLGISIAAVEIWNLTTSDGNPRRLLRIGSGVFVGAFLVASCFGCLHQQSHWLPWSNLLQPVQFVKANAGPSDVVYVPHERDYWAWGWYYLGPGSINPLNTDYDDQLEGVALASRPSISNHMEGVRTFWVVYRAGDEDAEGLLEELNGYSREVEREFRNIIVERLTK